MVMETLASSTKMFPSLAASQSHIFFFAFTHKIMTLVPPEKRSINCVFVPVTTLGQHTEADYHNCCRGRPISAVSHQLKEWPDVCMMPPSRLLASGAALMVMRMAQSKAWDTQ